MKRSSRVLALMLALALSGCVSAPQSCPIGLMSSTRIDLFFGLNRPGGQISPGEWQSFNDGTLSATFPQGFTVLDGTGQWHDEHEPSKVVTVIVAKDASYAGAIAAATRIYRERFQQQSVGVSVSPTCAKF